jgi:membrane protease YdiL (CAAX protease family)
VSRLRAAAPALAAGVALALAPAAMGSRASWLAVAALAAWAAWCIHRHRFEDGALLVVAVGTVAVFAASPLVMIVPFVTPLVPALLVVMFTWWRNPPRPPLPWIRLGRFGWSGALVAALVAAVAGVVAVGAREAAAHLTAPRGSLIGILLISPYRSPWVPPNWTALDRAFQALTLGLLVGGAEEVVFRGALQERLTRTLGSWPGIVAQALAYGLSGFGLASMAVAIGFHGGLGGAAGALLALGLGFLLGILRQLAGGLFAPVVAHALANAAIVLAVRWP